MVKTLQPAAVVVEDSKVNRTLRFEKTKEVLENLITDRISERSKDGYFFCTVSFVKDDGNIDYDKREVFVEKVAPTLEGLGYKIGYSEGDHSRYAGIDWEDADKNTIKE